MKAYKFTVEGVAAPGVLIVCSTLDETAREYAQIHVDMYNMACRQAGSNLKIKLTDSSPVVIKLAPGNCIYLDNGDF